jgi:hypothetical protein
MVRAVASSKSPFTGHEQVYSYDMACWQATMTLPPMKRAQAGAWQAFFMLLKGRANTFLLGDPDGKNPEGSVTNALTSSAGAIGATTINLATNGTFKAGDYIQFGSGATSQLHMILEDESSLTPTINFEPALKVAVASFAQTQVTGAKCVMRMDSNDLGWDADHVSKYGFSFSCTEAL